MDNIFQSNLTKSQVDTQKALKANIQFCTKLTRDLENTFNVVVQGKRSSEDSFEVQVYTPSQAGRYGFGFRFTVTDQGVSFYDERGLWAETLARILNVTISSEYDAKALDLEIMRGAVKSGKIVYHPNSACGDHYSLGLNVNEGPDLDSQIKLIIGCLMAHGITTKL